MEEEYVSSEKEYPTFFDKPSQPEFVWKNLAIGIAVVIFVIFCIYLWVSQSIKASDYKSMDLSTKNQDSQSVQGASDYGPPDPGKSTIQSKTPVSPDPTVPATSPTATPKPTSAPTSTPNPTATPTPNPTATPTPNPTASPVPTPTNTPTPTNSPTPTDTGTPTPTTTH